MTVELTRDTIVRFPAGTVLELPAEEAKRLIMLGNAAEKKTAPKKAAGTKK